MFLPGDFEGEAREHGSEKGEPVEATGSSPVRSKRDTELLQLSECRVGQPLIALP